MGYMHISNLYKDQTVLLFREVYALEKIHGTSAHVSFLNGDVRFFSGEQSDRFRALFEREKLEAAFSSLGHSDVTVNGECHGGKVQGMRETYGDALRFVAFDVKIGETWLSVPNAEDVARKVGLEFVYYDRTPGTVEALDAERDADSVQAIRNGMGPGKKREGVVIRPLVELRDGRGARVIAKHKRDDFRETATPRKVLDPAQAKVLADAEAIAAEWVTDMRLTHVLDRLRADGWVPAMASTPAVIAAMVEDVEREAVGEIVTGRAARKAIGDATARMFRQRLKDALRDAG